MTHLRVTMIVRLACLSLALGWAFSGNHPPAQAQQNQAVETVDSVKFANLDERLRKIDESQLRQYARQNDVDSRMTHMEGMVQGIGLLLGLLSSGSIVLQLRGGKKE